MVVHPGAEIRGDHFRAAGLVAAGCRSMGALSGRTTGQRQSPRVHHFHRAAARGRRGSLKVNLSGGIVPERASLEMTALGHEEPFMMRRRHGEGGSEAAAYPGPSQN